MSRKRFPTRLVLLEVKRTSDDLIRYRVVINEDLQTCRSGEDLRQPWPLPLRLVANQPNFGHTNLLSDGIEHVDINRHLLGCIKLGHVMEGGQPPSQNIHLVNTDGCKMYLK
jgi:hypothetical protein